MTIHPQRPAPAVLFVDDEERILRTLQVLFRPHCRVLTTTDAREALQLLQAEDIAVLVSDQRMPVMSGSELLARARELAPDTVRILLTGYADVDSAIHALNDGEIHRYLTKPWTVEGIVRTVRDALAVAEAVRAPVIPDLQEPLRPALAGILVIDDDPATLAAIRSMAAPGQPVMHATGLTRAVETLGSCPIGVIVTDIVVGGDDMTHLLRTLKQQYPEVLSIVVTGTRDTPRLIRLINQAQVFRYFPKPLRSGIVARGLASAMTRYNEARRLPLPASARVEDATTEVERTLSRRIGEYLARLRSRNAATTG
ncbi:MAG: response regulator [Pseudomonadota bacterium]